MQKSKILVTGGTGLVGSALQELVKHRCPDYEFIFIGRSQCDLMDADRTMNYFQAQKPQLVIHLAANVGGLFKNMSQPVEMLEDNVRMNSNVLRACHVTGVKKLISCLSTCIFPDKTTYPIDEGMLHEGPPHESNYAYAYSKRLLEIHSRAYRDQYQDNFTCVIPTNIYGPHDNFSLTDGHVIPALIHRCYLAKATSNDFVVAGTGTPLRQFLYAEDLARLILWALENYEEGSSLILSSEEEVSIETVARIIARRFDYEDRLVFDTSRSDGQWKKTANNSKLRSLFPDITFTGIEQGIASTVDWFLDHYEECRK